MGAQQRMHGMTLIEVLIGVSILVILIAIAVPAFNSHIAKSTQRSVTLEFITAMAYARAESVKRGSNVHLRSLSGTQLWSAGWCVTTAANCNGEVIRKFDMPGGIVVKSSAASHTVFTFNSQGFLETSTDTVSFCTGEHDKKITVTPLGQALAQDCTCNSDSLCV